MPWGLEGFNKPSIEAISRTDPNPNPMTVGTVRKQDTDRTSVTPESKITNPALTPQESTIGQGQLTLPHHGTLIIDKMEILTPMEIHNTETTATNTPE